MKPIIQVEGLSKQFRLGKQREPYRTLRDSVAGGVRNAWNRLRRHHDAASSNTSDFWALKDVSFDVQPGEVVGIIGRNGSGKSTLLKILSQIYEPTSGRAVLRGRLASLLEVGTGFHPELTGRENIFLNGSILGMTRREIQRKFDEIVAFSEIEQFLDTPVKRYSSGMYVRLAFAVAAHLEPEVLIVDEVLAVGDAAFQTRCLGKMGQVAKSGRTVIFVSHSMTAIQKLCTRGIVISKGRIIHDGNTSDAIQTYTGSLFSESELSLSFLNHPGRTAESNPSIQHVELKAKNETSIRMGSDLEIHAKFSSNVPLSTIDFGIVIKDILQSPIFGINNKITKCIQPKFPINQGSIVGTLPHIPLMPGIYTIDLYFGSNGHDSDIVLDAMQFEVQPYDVFGTGKLPPRNCGNVFHPATWSITPATEIK